MLNALTHRAAAKLLGVRLGELAREKGYTGKQISAATGVSETTISRIFTGKFCSKSEYLVCIADAVGADVALYNRG